MTRFRVPFADRRERSELELERTREIQARLAGIASSAGGVDLAELEAARARDTKRRAELEQQAAEARGRARAGHERDTFKAALEGAPTARIAPPDVRRKLSQGERRERARATARARASRFAELLRVNGTLDADVRPFDPNVDEAAGWAFEHPRAALAVAYPRVALGIVHGFTGSGRDVRCLADRKYLTYAIALIASATPTNRAGFAAVSWGYSQGALGCYMRNPHHAPHKIHGHAEHYSREVIRSARKRRDGTSYGTRAWFLESMEAFAPGLVSQHQPNAAVLEPIERGTSGYAFNQTWFTADAFEGHRKNGRWCHHPDVIEFVEGRKLGELERARRLAEFEHGTAKRPELTDEQRRERAERRAVRAACAELADELASHVPIDWGDLEDELEPDPPPLE
jgi:hypothetical protein